MDKKKVVAFVPIKLNSQRLPKKNILPLGGQPLCWHVTNTLTKLDKVDETYVYCSDEAVKEYLPQDIKFLKRNIDLDGDLVKGFEIYRSFITEVDADIYILAHTTSPFTKIETLNEALEKVLYEDFDSAFSVQKFQTFSWYEDKPINYDLKNVPRTQDIKPVFIETSGFFIFEREVFTKHNRRIGFNPYLQEVNSFEAIDIDTQEDYDFAKKILNNIEGV